MSNLEKVKLPENVKESLDKMLKTLNVSQVYDTLHNERIYLSEWKEAKDYFYNKNSLLLMQALVLGYEVEESGEDKLRHWVYTNEMNSTFNAEYEKEKENEVIVKVLDILNITIKGVNA